MIEEQVPGIEEEVDLEQAAIETWDRVFSVDTEHASKVWHVSYSFPIEEAPEEEGEDPKIGTAGEQFAATSKHKALSRIIEVLTNPETMKLTKFESDRYEDGMDLLKDFFGREGSNIDISLVTLI